MRTVVAVFFAAVLAAVLPGAAFAQAKPPVTAFGSLPEIEDVQISESGRYLAYLIHRPGQPSSVRVLDLQTRSETVAAVTGGVPHSLIGWAGDERIIALVSRQEEIRGALERYDVSRVVSIAREGGDIKALLGNRTRMVAVRPIGSPQRIPGERHHWIVPGVERDGVNLYRVNVVTDDAELIERGQNNTQSWVVDARGKPVMRVDYDRREKQIRLNVREADGKWAFRGAFPAGLTDEDQAVFSPIGLTEDGKTLWVRYRAPGADRIEIRTYDLATGKLGATIVSDPRVDAGSAIAHRWTGAMIGTAYYRDTLEINYTDPKWAALHRSIKAAFPGAMPRIVDYDKAETRIVVAVQGPQTPRTYYLLDARTMEMGIIGESYPQLSADKLGRMEAVSWAARDGMQISGYFTHPAGARSGPHPTVVLVHGGPAARDVQDFDFWAQLFANRGYAVFQPNYRGSAGFGLAFERAGWGKWGTAMQDDVKDGLDQLVAQGKVDASRVCIVGASYGGYAALMSAVRYPDAWKCAIGVNGVYDLADMVVRQQTYTGRRSSNVQYWLTAMGGAGNEDRGPLVGASPARRADAVRAPVMLIHGKIDIRVPWRESDQMNTALTRAGKPVEFITLEGDDHFLSKAETRTEALTAMERFVATHLGTPN